MDINKVAKAIEEDAGEPIEGLLDSLAEMKAGKVAREYSAEQLLLRSARQKLKLSQARFATLIDTPVATLRDWEQGRFKPAGSAIVLCRVAIKNPEVLRDLVA
jgi:putative transcriptional regulator